MFSLRSSSAAACVGLNFAAAGDQDHVRRLLVAAFQDVHPLGYIRGRGELRAVDHRQILAGQDQHGRAVTAFNGQLPGCGGFGGIRWTNGDKTVNGAQICELLIG